MMATLAFNESFLASLTGDCSETQILNSNGSEAVPNGYTTGETNTVSDDPTELYVCPECKVSFANKKYLKNHMKRKCVRRRYKEGNEYECGHCSHSFKLMSQLTQHMSLHTDGKPFKCQHCDKSFLTKGNLKRHCVIHKEVGVQQYHCGKCTKVFAYPSLLTAHLKSHEGEKPFKCGICARFFSNANAFRLHTESRHMVDGKFPCEICQEILNEATELIVHMKTHSENDSLKCHSCYARFSSLKNLETHVCGNFGGKPLLCTLCNIEYADTESYCKHTCILNSTNRKCVCCLKELKSIWHLREHLITHTGEKPYHCELCLKSFRRKRELDIHKTKHLNKKCFQCTYCENKFSSEAYLKQHIRNEHREKKFVCDICNHSFMHNSVLRNHMSFHIKTGNRKFGKRHERVGQLVPMSNSPQDLEIESQDSIQPTEEGKNNKGTENLKLFKTGSEKLLQTCDNNKNLERKNKDLNKPQNSIPSETNKGSSDTFDEPSNSYVQCNANTLQCKICLQIFDSLSFLLRHLKEYHNVGKPFKCDLCSRSFASAANLTQHQTSHKVASGKYKCIHCGRNYKAMHKLREHLRCKHNELINDVTDLELEVQHNAYNGNNGENQITKIQGSSDSYLDIQKLNSTHTFIPFDEKLLLSDAGDRILQLVPIEVTVNSEELGREITE